MTPFRFIIMQQSGESSREKIMSNIQQAELNRRKQKEEIVSKGNRVNNQISEEITRKMNNLQVLDMDQIEDCPKAFSIKSEEDLVHVPLGYNLEGISSPNNSQMEKSAVKGSQISPRSWVCPKHHETAGKSEINCSAEACSTMQRNLLGAQVSTLPTSNQVCGPIEPVHSRCTNEYKLCMCEVKLHKNPESCWLVAKGTVYDVTNYIKNHPGGTRSILKKSGGKDCTEDMHFHSKKARKEWETFKVGRLLPCGDVHEESCVVM